MTDMEDNLKQQVDLLQVQVDRLQYMMERIVKSDKIIPNRNIYLLDGGKLVTGAGNGTKIGESTSDKLAFYGVAPVDQPATVTDANSVGGTYNQSQVQNIADTVNTVIDRLQELGLIA